MQLEVPTVRRKLFAFRDTPILDLGRRLDGEYELAAPREHACESGVRDQVDGCFLRFFDDIAETARYTQESVVRRAHDSVLLLEVLFDRMILRHDGKHLMNPLRSSSY